MEYKGYKIIEEDNSVLIEGVKDFSPVHTFECGQCFRWIRQRDGSYTGVAKERVINVSFSDGMLRLYNSSLEDFKNIWYDYFDLGTDYLAVKEKITDDEIMKSAVKFGWGIRILKQDLWETLISFIISANNRIPRIMKSVEKISQLYGKEIYMDQNKYYTFPGYKEILNSTIENLNICRAGFRCKYIHSASKIINDEIISLKDIKKMDTDDAKSYLMKLAGVGPKVADCVLLYSGTKQDVFPTDVWVKRVMEELYFKKKCSLKDIQKMAEDKFGNFSGFAQQYLFYYARENKIGR
ncbi:DNA glycosylase [Herbivorax sp. ANBcel31]|uniref:DNA-3-methyladenine glycosylase family protein n=1 Tax=Herbivorax sp. ANBcel31 TaxID=3069754 RepID=UPI0027B345FA|nr:DNA glycosylase [Herbivorax sp. ANBcel31]MDQ2086429.1 DNA glycosylase [Herbivorax sp. ANBcel31]